MDYEIFLAERIAQLRRAKGPKEVSAREVSLSIGQNTNYINHIENRKTEPSMSAFFCICEYFGITPMDFFDAGSPYPAQLKDFMEDVKLLDENELLHLSSFIKSIVAKKK